MKPELVLATCADLHPDQSRSADQLSRVRVRGQPLRRWASVDRALRVLLKDRSGSTAQPSLHVGMKSEVGPLIKLNGPALDGQLGGVVGVGDGERRGVALYSPVVGVVRKAAYDVLQSDLDAEDAAQRVFMRLWLSQS